MSRLGSLCLELGLELRGDPELEVRGVAEPAAAGPHDIAPLTDPRRLGEAARSRAGALLLREAYPQDPRPQIICDDASAALGKLLTALTPEQPPPGEGVDPRAVVDASAVVEEGAWVGPFAVVGPEARVGAGSWIYPFSYVGRGAVLGENCRLGPGAVLGDGCVLEQGVALAPGAVVGGEGFGFWRDGEGWRRIPCQGAVTVGAGSQIGVNSCVDRGTLGHTALGQGVMLDNLVQVGHNCRLHDHALLCGQVGLAGSVTLGEGAVLAGQVGVADHRTVGAGAMVGAQSGVSRDVKEGETVMGYPAVPVRIWRRMVAQAARFARGTRNKEQGTGNKE